MAHLYAPEIDASMSSHNAPPHEITVERLPSPDRTRVTDQPINSHASGMEAIKGTAAPLPRRPRLLRASSNAAISGLRVVSRGIGHAPVLSSDADIGISQFGLIRDFDRRTRLMQRLLHLFPHLNDGLPLKLGVNPGFNIIPENQTGGQRDLL